MTKKMGEASGDDKEDYEMMIDIMKCSNCEEEFNSKDSLNRHRNNVHIAIDKNLQDFKCFNCQEKFNSMDSLTRHRKNIHIG